MLVTICHLRIAKKIIDLLLVDIIIRFLVQYECIWYCLNEFEFIDNFRVHSRICDRMNNSDDNTESEIGEILDDLREIRNYADYEWDKFDEDYFKKNLVKVRNNSKLALDEVESLKKSPPFKF